LEKRRQRREWDARSPLCTPFFVNLRENDMTETESDAPVHQFHGSTRRRFMATGAGAIAATALTLSKASAQDSTPHAHGGATPEPQASPEATPPPPPFNGVTGQELVDPEVRQSENGVLDTQLEARIGPVTVAGVQVTSMSYEGQFPGPTLRLKQSETLKVKLINHLEDVTNLHTHGFHVSPEGNSDNIFVHVDPGTEFDYEYNLPPTNLPGTFWYHPHAHGNTAEQTTFGMSGVIIVEGGLDELDGIKGLTDRVMVLQSTQFDGNGNMVPFNSQSATSRMRLINGQLQPSITMRPGETQRWRIANNSSDDFFLLALSGHKLYQIAGDGCAFNRTQELDQLLLAPAERAEILVQASSTPGAYEFRTLLWGPDYQAQPDLLLATVEIAGDAIEPQAIPMDLIPWDDLRQRTIDNRRTTEFQEPGAPLYLAIDGKHWDPDRIDQEVKLNTLEEWTLVNSSSHWHPFHIHVNDFQVVSFNGEPVEAYGLNDTVVLPPDSETVVLITFDEFKGKFVYHCHILSHEDFGMMANVLVVE
jgi:FtsP/CotA-like multicopper oxidase with cupredoxin domain